MSLPELARRARAEGERLFSRAEVERAIDRLAVRLTVEFAEVNPLLLCVLNGGLPFTGALMQRLQFPLTLSYVHVGRYGDRTRGGALSWQARPQAELDRRTVFLVDDILDEGVTINALKDWCLEAGARDVHSVVLLDKSFTLTGTSRADFAALDCPDRYVFGWGMDVEGDWRNRPDMDALPEALTAAAEAPGADG